MSEEVTDLLDSRNEYLQERTLDILTKRQVDDCEAREPADLIESLESQEQRGLMIGLFLANSESTPTHPPSNHRSYA